MRRPSRWATLALVFLLASFGALGFTISQHVPTGSIDVRIQARHNADRRIEFALQQREGAGWGERILADARYLPREVAHTRWVSSSPYTLQVTPTDQAVPVRTAARSSGAHWFRGQAVDGFTPVIEVSCNNWAPSIWWVIFWMEAPPLADGYHNQRLVLREGQWSVEVGEQTFTFHIGRFAADNVEVSHLHPQVGTAAWLQGEEARTFFYALVDAGQLSDRISARRGMQEIEFDLTELSQLDHWHTKKCG